MSIPQAKLLKVLLIGDSCTDVYHYGDCDRLSPEAPVPILKETRSESRPGMAANVMHNLQSFGIIVDFHTNTETIEKHRYIDEKFNQHLFRVDINEHFKTEELQLEDLQVLTNYDAVVISDYNKGLLTPETCMQITKACAEKGVLVFVDSKKKDLSCFHNCIVKINKQEHTQMKKEPINSQIITTLGSGGAQHGYTTYHIVKPVEVFDVCGAGDVFLASLVYGHLKNGGFQRSIPLANEMASISVSHMGTYILTEEDVEKYHDLCVRH
jgi:bifunctional ADP-heptose synthase (sugar kinase/adenylyltransferase)